MDVRLSAAHLFVSTWSIENLLEGPISWQNFQSWLRFDLKIAGHKK